MCRGPPEGPRAASGWGEAGSLAAGRRAGMAGAQAAAPQVHGQLCKHVVLAWPRPHQPPVWVCCAVHTVQPASEAEPSHACPRRSAHAT